jgi:membrane protein
MIRSNQVLPRAAAIRLDGARVKAVTAGADGTTQRTVGNAAVATAIVALLFLHLAASGRRVRVAQPTAVYGVPASLETAAVRHGQEANTPTEIPPLGWRDIAWRVLHEVVEDRVTLIAAGVTYYLLLALVPSLAVIVSVYGLFNDRATVLHHVSLLAGILPPGGMDIITDQLTRLTSTPNTTLSVTLVFSLVVALWSSSAGINSLFEAMNIAYDEAEKRNYFVRTATALGFTLGALVAAAVFLATVVVIPLVFEALYLPKGLEWLILIASYLLMLGLTFLGVSALYRWGPSRREAKWRWVSPGAIFTVVCVAIVSLLFSWYASTFANYSATYGSLGALVGMLTWIWLSVIILITGAELNSEAEHQTARDSTVGRPKALGRRGAYMADHVAVVGARATTDGKPPSATNG